MALTLAETFRSEFVRGLVQRSAEAPASGYGPPVPRRLIRYWDAPASIPNDVRECLDSWEPLAERGVEVLLFGRADAREFIQQDLSAEHSAAFDRCYHPAMQSDYFRLCYVAARGGCYVDADDAYGGLPLDPIFERSLLTVQPLCYDLVSDAMVPPALFTRPGADASGWIFYFNNNPLIAPAGHQVVRRALERATGLILSPAAHDYPEIQSTTGPGNLTASVVACADAGVDLDLWVASDWDRYATSVWPLGYREDSRNWRIGNQRAFAQDERGSSR